ncbi:MAG: hypothetical protein AMJ81_11035 [Phycisphaerae bacterium SM23_33]|nr:MAG: hypothetical protein AMJ81_11035 [Phycisphaerae bacterium SM23_33]
MSLAAAAPGGEGAVRGFARAGKTYWAVGDGGLVLRSDDGGREWQRAACPAAGDFSAVGFSDEKTGYIVGGRGLPGHPAGRGVGVILRTVDGGKTWSEAPAVGLGQWGGRPAGAGPLPYLRGGWLQEPGGIVFGQPTALCPSGVWMSVTGGRVWAPVSTESRGELLGGDCLDANNACLVGPNHRIVFLHRLKELPIPRLAISSEAALAAVRYLAPEACWVAGENGSALLHTGSGRGWQPLALPLARGTRRLADLEAIAAGDKGEVYLAGGLAGVIFHAGAGGGKLEALPGPRPGPVHALMSTPDGELLAGGDGGRIWRSADGGKSWKLLHGGGQVDVLFIAGPGEVSILPALVAHAAAGADAAVLFAAMPAVGPGPPPDGRLRGDVALRSAAAAAGAAGAFVLTDFDSVADQASAQRLDEQGILQRWSARLDVPARPEMLRQLVAAVRLYQPEVVAVGPRRYQALGLACESGLVSGLAAEAVKMAAEASAFPELEKLGLAAWRVKRVVTGLGENADFTPPWKKPPALSRQETAVEFVGWRYPIPAQTSLSVLALRAGWLMPWIGPMDRPACVTGFRCPQILPQAPLFTSGLSPARLRLEATPPVGEAIASGAVLRATALLGRNLAVTVGPLLEAVKARPDDPLPADMLYLLMVRLLEQGELAAAADVNRTLLAHGRAHPLCDRINVASVAMAASSEWQQAILRIRSAAAPGPAEATPFKAVLDRLLEPRWRVWVEDEPGTMLLAQGRALLKDFESARAAHRQLVAFTTDEAWRRFAETELAALEEPALAVVKGDGLVVPTPAGAVSVDGRLDEDFWKRAPALSLQPAVDVPARSTRHGAAAFAGLGTGLGR